MRINGKWTLTALLALALALAGCGGGKEAPSNAVVEQAGGAPMEYAAAAEAGPAMKSDAGNARRDALPSLTQSDLYSPLTQRRVIKNADLYLEVPDLEEGLGRAGNIADVSGGLVTGSFISGGEKGGANGSRQASITLRVPADSFDRVMADLRDLGRVRSEQTSTQDVTEEFIDLEARVANLEEQERRIRAILSRANTIEEIMQVERELARIRGEIDSFKGRLNFLADQSGFSTINLNLVETALASTTIDAKGWDGVWQRAARAFVGMTNAVLSFAAALVVFIAGLIPVLVFLTIAAGAVLSIMRLYRNRRGARLPTDAGGSPQ